MTMSSQMCSAGTGMASQQGCAGPENSSIKQCEAVGEAEQAGKLQREGF